MHAISEIEAMRKQIEEEIRANMAMMESSSENWEQRVKKPHAYLHLTYMESMMTLRR